MYGYTSVQDKETQADEFDIMLRVELGLNLDLKTIGSTGRFIPGTGLFRAGRAFQTKKGKEKKERKPKPIVKTTPEVIKKQPPTVALEGQNLKTTPEVIEKQPPTGVLEQEGLKKTSKPTEKRPTAQALEKEMTTKKFKVDVDLELPWTLRPLEVTGMTTSEKKKHRDKIKQLIYFGSPDLPDALQSPLRKKQEAPKPELTPFEPPPIPQYILDFDFSDPLGLKKDLAKEAESKEKEPKEGKEKRRAEEAQAKVTDWLHDNKHRPAHKR